MFALTRRLALRPAWPEDAGDLAGLLPNDVRRHDITPCVIATRDGGVPRIVGAGWIMAADDVRELGIAIAPDAQGLGYATEAGRALLGMARYGLGLRSLAARVATTDRAARRLLGKLGFREAGAAEATDGTSDVTPVSSSTWT